MDKYRAGDQKGFVIESLWKFLLYTEIALASYREIVDRPTGLPADFAEKALIEYLDNAEFLANDFAVRLERAVDDLLRVGPIKGVEASRLAISEQLHSGAIAELRRLLNQALRDKTRVVVLIDNLDRVWERGNGAVPLSEFMLGLITAAEQIEAEFRYEARRREALEVAVAVFLRSDIFQEVASVAKEPDKIPVVRINWDDRELLLQVLEERYLATREGRGLPDELWDRYFTPMVRGVPVRDYMTWRALPRPRDLIFFANQAITAAINHRNPRIEERDILLAERDYSRFALEMLEVEGTDRYGALIEVLFEFIGTDSILSRTHLDAILTTADVRPETFDEVIHYLRAMSFLGVRIGDREFSFVEDPWDLAKADVLSARLDDEAGRSYAVHPAFRPYLEIEDPDVPPGQLALGD